MKIFPAPPEELFSRMVKVLFYGLKTMGLAPFSIQFKTLARNSPNTSIKIFLFSRIGLLYNLVLATLIQIMGILTIPFLASSRYPKVSPLNQALDLMIHILHAATRAFIVVYLALRQKKAAVIMNRLLDVHFLLSGAKKQLSNKRTHIFLLGQMAFYILLWAGTTSLNAALNFRLDVLSSHLIHVINYFFILEYSNILRVVAREIEILNQNLSNLTDFPSYLFCTSLPHEHLAILSLPAHSQLATLKLLHDVRTTLFELSQEISDFFSFPILFSITCVFVSVIQGFYFSIITIFASIGDVSIMAYIDHVMFILLSGIPLVSLASNVTEAAKKARLTGRIVHALLATAKKQEITSELKQFSLHLIHENISFTACGFFKLDYTLIQSIFGATATYLVIVFQFVKLTNDEH